MKFILRLPFVICVPDSSSTVSGSSTLAHTLKTYSRMKMVQDTISSLKKVFSYASYSEGIDSRTIANTLTIMSPTIPKLTNREVRSSGQ